MVRSFSWRGLGFRLPTFLVSCMRPNGLGSQTENESSPLPVVHQTFSMISIRSHSVLKSAKYGEFTLMLDRDLSLRNASNA